MQQDHQTPLKAELKNVIYKLRQCKKTNRDLTTMSNRLTAESVSTQLPKETRGCH